MNEAERRLWFASNTDCCQYTLPIVGSNKNPPVGYEAKSGSGRCRCTGNGRGLNSCGELCCDNSPYTSTDPSSSYYFKKRRQWKYLQFMLATYRIKSLQ